MDFKGLGRNMFSGKCFGKEIVRVDNFRAKTILFPLIRISPEARVNINLLPDCKDCVVGILSTCGDRGILADDVARPGVWTMVDFWGSGCPTIDGTSSRPVCARTRVSCHASKLPRQSRRLWSEPRVQRQQTRFNRN